MNIASFLQHWRIEENPFRAEEARHDAVFARLDQAAVAHPDFEKVVGDLSRPSTSIVFGEKGAGKTAIRLQLAERVAAFNEKHPASKLLLVAYDDLNPFLDRLLSRLRPVKPGSTDDTVQRLKSIKLTDHFDAILHLSTVRVIDLLLLGEDGREAHVKALRAAEPSLRLDAQILQALYDRAEGYELRANELRGRARVPISRYRRLWRSLATFGWILPLVTAVLALTVPRDIIPAGVWLYALIGAAVVWGGLAAKWFLWDAWMLRRRAGRIVRAMRTVPRVVETLAAALERIDPADLAAASLPEDDSDEKRYAHTARLKRLLRLMGYTGLIVIIDRVDEPTAVNGNVEAMRAIIWPLLHNKFLQQDGLGLKLLLPAELRHEVLRESSTFFQEARLDKQNFIERLTWTGAALYDMCNARLNACRQPGADSVSLTDLFEPEVTRQDLVDSLDQMRQPRDAFKLIYQCLQEHCSNVTIDQERWRIPRLILESVRKQQADRVQMLQRGYRPA